MSSDDRQAGQSCRRWLSMPVLFVSRKYDTTATLRTVNRQQDRHR
jgi:hypothetical protein